MQLGSSDLYTATSHPFLCPVLQTYVHGALRSRSVRVLRPFLTVLFCMLSLLCGLVKLGIGSSHWTDITAGFASGSFIAVYLVIVTLIYGIPNHWL